MLSVSLVLSIHKVLSVALALSIHNICSSPPRNSVYPRQIPPFYLLVFHHTQQKNKHRHRNVFQKKTRGLMKNVFYLSICNTVLCKKQNRKSKPLLPKDQVWPQEVTESSGGRDGLAGCLASIFPRITCSDGVVGAVGSGLYSYAPRGAFSSWDHSASATRTCAQQLLQHLLTRFVAACAPILLF
jgi:hypothetical protein